MVDIIISKEIKSKKLYNSKNSYARYLNYFDEEHLTLDIEDFTNRSVQVINESSTIFEVYTRDNILKIENININESYIVCNKYIYLIHSDKISLVNMEIGKLIFEKDSTIIYDHYFFDEQIILIYEKNESHFISIYNSKTSSLLFERENYYISFTKQFETTDKIYFCLKIENDTREYECYEIDIFQNYVKRIGDYLIDIIEDHLLYIKDNYLYVDNNNTNVFFPEIPNEENGLLFTREFIYYFLTDKKIYMENSIIKFCHGKYFVESKEFIHILDEDLDIIYTAERNNRFIDDVKYNDNCYTIILFTIDTEFIVSPKRQILEIKHQDLELPYK